MNPNDPANPSDEPVGAAPRRSGRTGASAGTTFAQAKQSVASGARTAAAKVSSAAGAAASRLKDDASDYVTEKRRGVADRIGGYSAAVHASADSLEEQDPNIAWFTHRAADRLQGMADYLRDRDLAGLRDDAEQFARRHPVAFFGGLFVAGLVVGNVIKAAQRGTRTSTPPGPPRADPLNPDLGASPDAAASVASPADEPVRPEDLR